MSKILIVARGGYGDIFPLLAIGAELKRRHHEVEVSAESHHAQACLDLGLRLHALHKQQRSAVQATGWHSALGPTLAPDGLADEIDQLRTLAVNADLIIGNQLSYAGSVVRKLLNKKWVFCAASPLAIPSRHDPPLWPLVNRLQEATTALGLPQTHYLHLARAATRLLMRRQLMLQRRLGLDTREHPRFEGMYSPSLNLLPTSPTLLDPQDDWPPGTRLTGFAWYEPRFLGDARQAEELRAFAESGPPPLVFTAGGGRRTNPGRFFEECIAAATLMGRRAIIVAGARAREGLRVGKDIRLTGYLPYSHLFGLAASVVHSGGIGTIGWAMRAGVPSLLVPSDWDQHDNARRAARRGLAHVLPMRRFAAANVAHAIAALLNDTSLHQRLRDLAPGVAAEDGARASADAVEAELASQLT